MTYYINLNYGIKCVDEEYEITFDMDKSQIHNILHKSPEYIMDSMEYYKDFRIDYNSYEKAVAIEFFPSSELFVKSDDLTKLKETDLFKLSFKRLNKILSTVDSGYKDNGCGIISLKYGIGTYSEDSGGCICQSIIIFKKGYYAPLGW